MPLMICPKCKKFHYVPGACPAPIGLAGPALISGSSRAANTKPAPKSVVSRLKGDKPPDESHAKATKAKPVKAETPKPDSVASRPSRAGGAPAPILDQAESAAAHLAPKRGRPISPAPKSKRTEYQRKLMRERRAKAKE